MRALAIVALLAGAARAQPVQVTPAETLAKVEATYAKIDQLTAAFDQTVVNAAFGTTKTTTGKLYLAKPDLMRWDYDKARAKQPDPSFIFDGATLWVVEPSKLQVLKTTVSSSQLPIALSFVTGKLSSELALGTTPTERLVPGGLVLTLTPKRPIAQLAKLYLVIYPTTWQVARSIVVNSNGDETTFAFRAVNPRARLDRKRTFTFDPAKVPMFKVVTPAPAAAPAPAPPPAKTP